MGADHTGMLARVLDALKDVKASSTTKAPPLLRLAWRMGILIPPPILAGFWFNFLFLGFFFGVSLGLLMALFYLVFVPEQARLVLTTLPIAALFAGVMFGLFMAITSRVQASRYDLPIWQSLVDAERNSR